ncbi:MAG: hypothetical protein ACR2O1_00105 [Boseongicola sp.]
MENTTAGPDHRVVCAVDDRVLHRERAAMTVSDDDRRGHSLPLNADN